MTSKEYWQKRETEHAKKNKMSEQTYAEEIRKTYAYMADQIQKEIDGFYANTPMLRRFRWQKQREGFLSSISKSMAGKRRNTSKKKIFPTRRMKRCGCTMQP